MGFEYDSNTKFTFYNLPLIKGSKFNHYWDLKFKFPIKTDPSFGMTNSLTPHSFFDISNLIIIINIDEHDSYSPVYVGGIVNKLEYYSRPRKYWIK